MYSVLEELQELKYTKAPQLKYNKIDAYSSTVARPKKELEQVRVTVSHSLHPGSYHKICKPTHQMPNTISQSAQFQSAREPVAKGLLMQTRFPNPAHNNAHICT